MTASDWLVIFDCDGVLVDSESIACAVLSQHLCAMGLPYTPAACLQQFTGLSLSSCRTQIEHTHGVTLSPDFFDALQQDTFARFQHELQAIPNVTTALDWLDTQQIPYCVASSGSLEKMRFTLKHTGLLARLEPQLFSAQQVRHGKPAPDLFLYAAQCMQRAPTRCWVIEDSRPGIEAGLAAGMQVCAFCHPHAVPGTVSLRDMAELPTLIERQLALSHCRDAY